MFKIYLLSIFNGRMKRSSYWKWLTWASLFLTIAFVPLILAAVTQVIDATSSGSALPSDLGQIKFDLTNSRFLFCVACIIIFALMTFIASRKRLHDLNLPGYLAWLLLLPLLTDQFLENTIIDDVTQVAFCLVTFILGIIKGTKGVNKYGADPIN